MPKKPRPLPLSAVAVTATLHEIADTCALSGAVGVNASLALAEARDVASISGILPVAATLPLAERADTVAILGTVSFLTVASLPLGERGDAMNTGAQTLQPSELAFSDVGENTEYGGSGFITAASWYTYDSRYPLQNTPGCYYYDHNFRVTWNNAGGDWFDAAGTAQGSSAYATNSSIILPGGVETSFDWNVQTLVQQWSNGTYPNYGFMVQAGDNGTNFWRSRFYSISGKRPVLIVNGTTVLCARSVCITPGQVSGVGLGGSPDLVTAVDRRSLLWFDLSAFANVTITSAVLRLSCYQQFDAPNNTVKVFRLWNPGDLASIDSQHLGLAASYPFDANIESDANVMFVQQFADAGYATKWAQTKAPAQYMTAPDGNGFTLLNGLKGIRCEVVTGDNNAFEAYWSSWRGAGTHVKPLETLEETYVRYYLMFGNDWNAQPFSGKLPGIDGRHSYPTKLFDMGVGNSGNGCDGFTGYSARGSFDRSHQATDPLVARQGIGFAGDYNIDAVSPFGSDMWFDKNYLAALLRAQWYCVEYRFKLNTVTQPLEKPRLLTSLTCAGTVATATLTSAESSPLYANGQIWSIGGADPAYPAYRGSFPITVVDSTHFTFTVPAGTNPTPARNTSSDNQLLPNFLAGPGYGNNDGILEVWVNGRSAGRHTDIRYRHTRWIPDGSKFFGIDNFWFTIYQGGGAVSTTTGSAYLAAMVVAKAYIGPMSTATDPLWLQGKAVNEWVGISTATLSTMSVTLQQAAGLTDGGGNDIGYGNPRSGLLAYSGGALKASGSQFLIFGGGGQGAWAGNDVRSLRLADDAPVWTTVVNPTNVSQVWPRGGGTGSHAYLKDGVSPNARHSYWQLQFINARNKCFAFGAKNVWETDSGDFYNVDSVTLNAAWDTPGLHPNMPITRQWDGNWQCKHPTTEDVYACGQTKLAKWTQATDTWTVLNSSIVADLERACAAVDPNTNVVLVVGNYNGVSNAPSAVDCTTGAVTPGSWVGPYAGSVNIDAQYAAGLVYDSGISKFVLFQDDGYLYTIVRASNTTWSVDRLVATGTPPPVHSSNIPGYPIAIWSRMQYVPALKGIAILPSASLNLFFIRTST